MRRAGWVVGGLLLTVSIANCGSGSSSAPDTASVGGTYVGAVNDGSAGGGTVQAQLVDSFGALTGTWRASGGGFLSDTCYILGSTLEQGKVRFNVSRNQHYEDGALYVEDGGCSYRMSGTMQGSAISGSYDTYGCSAQRTGTFRLTR